MVKIAVPSHFVLVGCAFLLTFVFFVNESTLLLLLTLLTLNQWLPLIAGTATIKNNSRWSAVLALWLLIYCLVCVNPHRRLVSLTTLSYSILPYFILSCSLLCFYLISAQVLSAVFILLFNKSCYH